MKILFIWRKIDRVAGGVERFTSTLMNAMVSRGYDVSLLTWDHKDAVSHYPLDPKIAWTKIDIGNPDEVGGWKTRFQRMMFVRSFIKSDKPDVILCFESGIFLSIRLFIFDSRIPMISAERNAPSRHEFSGKRYGREVVFKSLLLADKITIQFERYREGYPPYLRKKMTAIANPVREAHMQASPRGVIGAPKTLLCVSRVAAHQKNPQVLIRAFAQIVPSLTDWRLVIAGDGDDAEVKRVTSLIKELKIEDKVQLLGKVSDIEALCASAHLFCLPSRYEGFPNALAEGLAHGLPAVGFEECAGVADLIENNVTGLLAKGNNNADSLAETLAVLMRDDDVRERMGKAASLSMKRYSPENVFNAWEEFLKNTALKKKTA